MGDSGVERARKVFRAAEDVLRWRHPSDAAPYDRYGPRHAGLTAAQSDEQTIAVRNGNACLTVASLPALRTASSTALFVPRTTTP